MKNFWIKLKAFFLGEETKVKADVSKAETDVKELFDKYKALIISKIDAEVAKAESAVSAVETKVASTKVKTLAELKAEEAKIISGATADVKAVEHSQKIKSLKFLMISSLCNLQTKITTRASWNSGGFFILKNFEYFLELSLALFNIIES